MGAYHPGSNASVSGDVRVRLNARPSVREVGLPETLVDCVGARGIADIVVDRARDAVLSVAVPWSHVQEVFCERAVLYTVVRADAITAEAIAGVKHVGGGKVACVARLVPVPAWISMACCMGEGWVYGWAPVYPHSSRSSRSCANMCSRCQGRNHPLLWIHPAWCWCAPRRSSNRENAPSTPVRAGRWNIKQRSALR